MMRWIFKPLEIFVESSQSHACIWLNGEPTAIGKRAQKVWNLAKYRVATDGAINEIHRRTEHILWPHIVCGDFDSADKSINTGTAELIELPDQNQTDLTKAIKWILEQNNCTKWSFDRIVVLGGLNGRFDHTMSTLSTLIRFSECLIPIVVLDSNNIVLAVPEGESRISINLCVTSRMCGILPIAQKSTVVTSRGLKYEMNNLPLAFGVCISSSNEVTTDHITLNSTAPLIFTIELTHDN